MAPCLQRLEVVATPAVLLLHLCRQVRHSRAVLAPGQQALVLLLLLGV